jgi:hypothetical protein
MEALGGPRLTSIEFDQVSRGKFGLACENTLQLSRSLA